MSISGLKHLILLLKTTLLKYNLLIEIVPFSDFLLYSQNCESITTINFRTFYHSERNLSLLTCLSLNCQYVSICLFHLMCFQDKPISISLLNNTFHCIIYHIFFIHSPNYGHLFVFFDSSMNNADVNICVQEFVWAQIFIFLGYIPCSI